MEDWGRAVRMASSSCFTNVSSILNPHSSLLIFLIPQSSILSHPSVGMLKPPERVLSSGQRVVTTLPRV